MVCELHTSHNGEAAIIVVLQHGFRAVVEPIITVEGVSMPTYEYHCQDCDRTFTMHQSLEERDSAPIECPHCQEENVEQVLTSFVAVTSKKS